MSQRDGGKPGAADGRSAEHCRWFWEGSFQRLDGLLQALKADSARSRATHLHSVPTGAPLQLAAQGERAVTMVRTFHALPSRVFDAWVAPGLIARWLGPRDLPLTSCRIEARAGGSFSLAWRNPDGSEMVLSGTYLEIRPPHRIVHAGTMRGEAFRVTTTFTAQGNDTAVTIAVEYASRQRRDEVMASRMKDRIADDCLRLDALLAAPPADATRD
jgi:uncharacterized protein YndB with AHSA1/START domain